MTLETVVVLPDFQIPLHDDQKIRRLARFVWQFQPDRLAHVGDLTDSTQIGQWVRGLRGEFNGGLEGGFSATREILDYFRKGYDGPWDLVRSNHDDRLEKAIESRLPGISGITIGGQLLNIQNALRLDHFGITWHTTPPEIAPGVLLMHGDEGGMSQIPGNTALQLAVRSGKSVVCGHTHRAGLAWSGVGTAQDRRALFGLEVGHAMQVSDAEYLGPARLNNWGNAFGILRIHRGTKKKVRVYPQLVPVHPDGSFVVDGVRY